MDQELKAYVDERLAKVDERDQELHDLVRLVATGLLGVNDRVELLRAETTHELARLKAEIDPSDKDLMARVGVLEERLERQSRDLFEAIRKIANPYR